MACCPQATNKLFPEPMLTKVNDAIWKCYKLGQFAMFDSWENWLGLVNSYIYYARKTQEIYLVLPYSVDFKAPGVR